MKKLFGVFMNSRRTEINDCEIDDIEEYRDEVFTKLSDVLLEEKRLMKRFYDFCEEYNNFEFDEMGINIDGADDVLRKANKIRDLLLSNVEDRLLYIFDNVESNMLKKSICMELDLSEISYKLTLEVKYDSFNLELV